MIEISIDVESTMYKLFKGDPDQQYSPYHPAPKRYFPMVLNLRVDNSDRYDFPKSLIGYP